MHCPHPPASSAAKRTTGRRRLAIACCLALAAPLAAAQEQAPPPAQDEVTNLDEVRVTGIRAAIATSVQTKAESTSIVEAISAEDLGKLPDISIADSISRLPGLATQRVDGRAQVINIRGMSEQFAGTLLNGREQVSTGDSRGVEFDQYPAELINAVVVYKTANAALVGQGLSGTIDLQTVRPLDLGGRRIVVSGQGEKNSLGDLTAGGSDRGYRFSASYVDRFADDTFGVAIGVARLDSPFQERHYKSWWWANTDLWGTPQGAKPADAIALQGTEGWVKTRDMTRDGLMAVLEYKPNDTWHSVLDLYYSRFDQDETMRGAMFTNDPWWNNGAVTYTAAQTTPFHGVPVVTSGTLSGIQPVIRNDNNTREDRIRAFGWNNEFNWGLYTLGLDASYSRAEREQSTLETYAGMPGPLDVDFRIPLGSGNGDYALPDMSDPGSVYLWDPQGWGHDGRLENSWQTDELQSWRVDLNRIVESSDFLRSYDVGYNHSKRTKDKRADVYFANLPGRTPVLVGSSFLLAPTRLGFAGMGDLLSYDPRALLYQYYDVTVSESNDDLQKDYGIEEKVDTFYFKANLDMDVGAVRLRGDAGVQYVRTDQRSSGVNIQADGPVAVKSMGATYGDILPSLNLVAEWGQGWNLRFGLAKQMMRPRINDMGAYGSVGVAVTNGVGEWTGSGGNPELQPYRANSVDLSLEKYFGEASYVALALFHKSLESYIYTRNVRWNFAGYDYEGDTPPASDWGMFSTPANGSGGYMRGVEFSTAIGGEEIHSSLEGFGALLNASYTESSIDPDGPDGGSSTDTIPGLSKIVANATVYYESNGFSARVSQRFRDPYRGEYSYIFGQRSYRYTRNERQVDLQLAYDFQQSGSLSGLTLMFQVNNLNNEPFRTQVSDSNGLGLFFPEEFTEYGRQYLVGFRYAL